MSKPEIQKIITAQNVRQEMSDVWQLVQKGLTGGDIVLTLGRKKRTNDQNAKLWPMLSDISRQVEWFGKKHKPEHWKDIVTGSFESCEFVPGIDGRIVMLGGRTSKYTKAKFCDLIEYIYAFGVDRKIVWSEPSTQVFEEYLERFKK